MTTQELQSKIEKIQSLGCKLSVEEITATILKKEAKSNSSKNWKKRDANKAASNKLDAKLSKMTKGEQNQYFEDARRQSVLNQLPSSMRKF